jgi:hypothetical protein
MGPLPQRYRMLIVAVVLVASIGGGAWLAQYLDLPLDGIGVGLGAGCLLAYLMTHDFTGRGPRSVRIRRR